MATKTIVCPECQAPAAPGRYACTACGALLASVALAPRPFGRAARDTAAASDAPEAPEALPRPSPSAPTEPMPFGDPAGVELAAERPRRKPVAPAWTRALAAEPVESAPGVEELWDDEPPSDAATAGTNGAAPHATSDLTADAGVPAPSRTPAAKAPQAAANVAPTASPKAALVAKVRRRAVPDAAALARIAPLAEPAPVAEPVLAAEPALAGEPKPAVGTAIPARHAAAPRPAPQSGAVPAPPHFELAARAEAAPNVGLAARAEAAPNVGLAARAEAAPNVGLAARAEAAPNVGLAARAEAAPNVAPAPRVEAAPPAARVEMAHPAAPRAPVPGWPPPGDRGPLAAPPPRVPAGVYLPPSATLPPGEALPIGSTTNGRTGASHPAATSTPPGASSERVSAADRLAQLDLPADTPRRVVAIGAVVAALGFLLPWTASLAGNDLLGDYWIRWGMAGPGNWIVVAILIVLAGSTLAGGRLAAIRVGLPSVALAMLLFGLTWPYFFGFPGRGVGLWVVLAGAILLVAGGLLDLRAGRHADPEPTV